MAIKSPLVSVIMPCYNAERFITEAIKSVQAQSITDWELLITDDCSTDNTRNLVKSISEDDPRIKLFDLPENNGAAVARNNSIMHAAGRYIAFLDSDDLWAEDKLEKQLAFMSSKSAGFSFTAYETISENGERNNIIHVPATLTYNQYLRNTIIGCLTVIVDRDIVGDFRMPLLRKRQDMATWLSILRQGVVAYGLDLPLASYRNVSTSISHNKLKAAAVVWKVYRDVEHLSLARSIFSFIGYGYNAVKKRLTHKY